MNDVAAVRYFAFLREVLNGCRGVVWCDFVDLLPSQIR